MCDCIVKYTLYSKVIPLLAKVPYYLILFNKLFQTIIVVVCDSLSKQSSYGAHRLVTEGVIVWQPTTIYCRLQILSN